MIHFGGRKAFPFIGFTISILFMLSMYSAPAESCSCMPTHPQTHYCKADYVILARILRKSTRQINGNDIYKVEIKKAYKTNPEANKFLRDGRIMTPGSSSACGLEFEIGKLYVIAGRGKTVGLCNYVKEYTKMSIVERRGSAGAYAKGCQCTIQPCFRGYCPQYEASCNWAPFGKCETYYSACVPSRKSNYSQNDVKSVRGEQLQCHWKRTPPYKECITK